MNILRTKVALIGDPRVGKTCIISQFIKQYFNNTYQTTLGIDYNTHDIKIKDSSMIVQLHILDLTGFSVFRELSIEIRDANFVIYVYDSTNLESFQNIKLWKENINQINKKCVEILVGNKIDLENKITVDETSIKAYTNQFNMKAFSVSAVKNYNLVTS
jgi:small GTP-binding protein